MGCVQLQLRPQWARCDEVLCQRAFRVRLHPALPAPSQSVLIRLCKHSTPIANLPFSKDGREGTGLQAQISADKCDPAPELRQRAPVDRQFAASTINAKAKLLAWTRTSPIGARIGGAALALIGVLPLGPSFFLPGQPGKVTNVR